MKRKPSQRNSRAGSEYETIVASFHRQFAADAVVTENEMINGRQIDVAIRKNVAGHDVLIIIECKDYKRRVEVGKVDELIGKMTDVRASKAVLVSDSGFTQGAITRAENDGRIELSSVIDTNNSKLRSRLTIPVQVAFHQLLLPIHLQIYPSPNRTIVTPEEFSITLRPLMEELFSWSETNNFDLKPGRHEFVREQLFATSNICARFTFEFEKQLITYADPNLFVRGNAQFSHLTQKLLPGGSLNLPSIDLNHMCAPWQQVPNDNTLKNCSTYLSYLQNFSPLMIDQHIDGFIKNTRSQ